MVEHFFSIILILKYASKIFVLFKVWFDRHCYRITKSASCIRCGYRKYGTCARVPSATKAYKNKNEIKAKKPRMKARRKEGIKKELKSQAGDYYKCFNGLSEARAYLPLRSFPEAEDELPNKPNPTPKFIHSSPRGMDKFPPPPKGGGREVNIRINSLVK